MDATLQAYYWTTLGMQIELGFWDTYFLLAVVVLLTAYTVDRDYVPFMGQPNDMVCRHAARFVFALLWLPVLLMVVVVNVIGWFLGRLDGHK